MNDNYMSEQFGTGLIRRPEKISIIIPCYNESQRIWTTLIKINAFLPACFKDFEIIVVNDGSSDDTEAVVLKAEKQIPAIKYLGYEVNQGKGYAIRKGVLHSTNELVLLTDADLSVPIEDIEKLLVWFDKGFEVVIGSRGLAESRILIRQPWWRQSMGKIFNIIIKIFLLRDFQDTQCGFKLLEGSCARKVFGCGVVNRFAYDVEFLFLAKTMGCEIKEVPIRWINSFASKVHPIKDSLQMAKDVVKIALKKKKLYPNLF
jgi:dolichyl-phosphate beta-glucosyltransferase